MRYFFAFVALIASVSICYPAMARKGGNTTKNLKQVEKLSSQAAVAFDKGDYQKAFNLYSKAHNILPDARITFAMVRCLESMKKYDEALKLVNRGLSENPDKILRARFKSRAEHLKSQLSKGFVQFDVVPLGAVVKVDGKVIGKTPVNSVVLTAGNHTVDVSKLGYGSVSKIIQVPGGKHITVSISLKSLSGRLTVTTKPISAKLYVDGKFMGKTPLVDLQLPVGPHELSFQAPGMTPERRQVTVTPASTIHLDVVMAQNTVAPPKASVKKGPWYTSWPGWTFLGVGVALGIGGGVLLYKAHQDHNTVNNTLDLLRNSPNVGLAYSQQDLQDKWNTANRNQKIGYGLIAGAGAAVITSVILFVTHTGTSSGSDKSDSSISPMVFCTPHGVGVFTRF